MTTHDLARTLDAVANQRPVVAGLTSERRRAIGADAQTLVDRESAVDGVVRWRRRIQPNNTEDA
jgi:thiamine pyrophosphate-dependent acetolactate synthase large subunit-like protein